MTMIVITTIIMISVISCISSRLLLLVLLFVIIIIHRTLSIFVVVVPVSACPSGLEALLRRQPHMESSARAARRQLLCTPCLPLDVSPGPSSQQAAASTQP